MRPQRLLRNLLTILTQLLILIQQARNLRLLILLDDHIPLLNRIKLLTAVGLVIHVLNPLEITSFNEEAGIR